MSDIIKEIKALKKEKKAFIFAHNYQVKEIFSIADFIGDSLELAKKAQEVTADIIIFAGVRFMAETAKILNPQKKVLLPDLNATCPMAAMIDKKKLQELKDKHPGIPVVCYVNTTAETKAQSDVCVTSSNAVEICRRLESNKIIFIPDQNLAGFIQLKLPHKKIIPFKGFCHVHANADKKYFQKIIQKHPQAKILIHPETPAKFYDFADHILSTGGMYNFIKNSNDKKFLIGTENGMCDRLKMDFPQKTFIPLLNQNCPDMKKITLEKILHTLKNETNEIKIEKNIFNLAQNSLQKMIEYL